MAIKPNFKMETFALNVRDGLSARRFRRVDPQRINARLIEEGLMDRGRDCGLLGRGELLFNAGKDSKRSNFFVFLKVDSANERVLVYYMNPDATETAPMREKDSKGRVRPGQSCFILKSYLPRDDPVKSAEAIVSDILHYSELKPDWEYRMESHLHCGRMFPGFTGEKRFADDGMSSIMDVLRIMAITNRDVVAITSHNSFNAKQFAAISLIAEEMGMVLLPAMELTSVTTAPNGPHFLCYGADVSAMHELWAIALNGRNNFSMPPFNDAGRMLDIIPRLYSGLVQIGKSLFMAAAHPFNLYKADKPVYDVGLVSAVETRNVSLGAVQGIFKLIQGVEAWNMTMSQKEPIPPLKDRNLKEFVHETCTSMLLVGTHQTPNSFAEAFAKSLFYEGTMQHSLAGTDDHYTPPMNYKCDGIPQARGHTSINMARVYNVGPDSKPTPKELIGMLLRGDALMKAKVYNRVQDGYLAVPEGRMEYDDWTYRLMRRMEKAGNRKYAAAVAADLAAGRISPREMINLAHTFGIGDYQ
jgi:hypothetical protein